MVLADFLTETRRKWLQAFKLFKTKKTKKARNRVSPAEPTTAPEIVRVCPCRTLPAAGLDETSYTSYDSHSLRDNTDSAYDSDLSTPTRTRPVCYATVTYFNVNDSDDSCSIHTEYTLLDYDPDAEDEKAQNMINESLELVSTL